jgi:hypothetical protein
MKRKLSKSFNWFQEPLQNPSLYVYSVQDPRNFRTDPGCESSESSPLSNGSIFSVFFNVYNRNFNFKIVKICLMTTIKFLARKF